MTTPRTHRFALASLPLALLAAACGSSSHSSTCNPSDPNACGGGNVCEQVSGGSPACFAPVVVSGRVYRLADNTNVQGARVVALDVNRAPLSKVAISAADGTYTLTVPATRQASGVPAAQEVTLRADAPAYLSFPSGIRVAVPVDLSGAVLNNAKYVVQSSLTSIGLIATSAGATLHGTVQTPPASGALVVAEQGGVGHTAVADASGAYAIYNLAAGDWTVKAYAKGVNYAPASVTALGATEDRAQDLTVQNTTTATVNGTLAPTGQNQPATLNTSAILVVKSTYSAAIDRGEAPPGLRVGNVTTNSFTLAGVPDGEYMVLAAFENDGYVRDISGIGGTSPADVTVTGGVATVPSQFKITGALTMGTDASGTSPITPVNATTPQLGDVWIVTSATPTFSWQSYPSIGTGTYHLSLVDALGNEIWAPTPIANSAGTISRTYDGTTALVAGETYQLRIFVYDTTNAEITRSEDLKGIFTYQP